MGNIVEANQSQVSTYNKEQVELVKNTVAKGATDDELKMFMYLASQYNLDPFKKEIWFMKYSGQTTIMTSRDGYLKYAQASSEFEGLISFVVKEGDTFEIDASEYKVTHKFGIKRGNIIGAWAKCDRAGKKPFISYVDFKEYNQRNRVWNKYPSAMIQKVAETFVLKRAFGINGLVTQEELQTEDIKTVNNNLVTGEQLKYMYKLADEKNVDAETIKEYMKESFDKEVSTELTKEEASQMIGMLQTIEKNLTTEEELEGDFSEIEDKHSYPYDSEINESEKDIKEDESIEAEVVEDEENLRWE